ncbi:TonB-linked SusC/RagA family outer membrane protein [Pedobacter sp. AK017]|uniref:SusC/RagA family TonB-linked outer membrane protein n=1 Tax=Pedobacter sp. AK017 TaxID=2723073 RepID=UPI0016175E97|nr:TonB-dependent receptor [Pedobacter sp. AK017]MBB5437741.1 TonB-linked SusC/RagA family outer membrane protein [Pedobacter sp. AK017]
MNRFLLLLIIVAGNLTLYAQNTTTKGVVSDAGGEPLMGVSVSIKGVGKGRSTGVDGSYTISTSNADAILVFSYIGYKTTEEPVNGRTTINVKLATDTKTMNEVVVIGYGTVKRKELTGAISSVKGEELSKVPVQNVASALAGRIAGVQVTAADGTPGSNPSITIRGGGSITQSNEPLYVIDGIPQTNGLGFLDPMDVESMDVLKDASATAIYGARGANGVILVTTKQPKAGKLALSYDMYFGAKDITKTLPVLNPYQYTLLQYEKSLGNATEEAKFLSNYGAFADLQSLYGDKAGVNWQDQLFGGTSNSQYHKFGVGGGSKETRFNFFYSHNNDEGIMLNSGSKKNVAKLNVTHNAGKKLRVTGIVNYSDQNTFGVGTREGNTRFNQLQNVFQFRPTFGLKGTDADLIGMEEDPYLQDDSGNTLQNPIINALSQQRSSANKILNLNAAVDYELFKNITYRGLVGLRTSGTKTKIFNDSRSVNAKRSGGPNGSIAQSDRNDWNYSNTLTYSNVFNQVHKLDVLVGQEQLYSQSENFSASSNRFPDQSLGLDDLSQGVLPGIPTSFSEDEKMFSLFSRANYTYKGRYIFSASLRADGSSKFGSDNKYGYFPSGAFAWRVIEEDFMKKIPVISDLKLRLSVGVAGNNRIPNYLSQALFQSGYYPLNNENVISVGSRTLPNPDLKWEKTRTQNIGVDVGFFNQRIQLTVDAYDNRTTDLLLNADVPNLSGYSTMLINVGATSNRGIEFTLNTVNLKDAGGFSWNTTFNMGFNYNKVISLTSGNQFMYGAASWGGLQEKDYIIRVGGAVGKMFGYKSNGLYQVNEFDYNPTTKVYTLKTGIPFDANNVPKPGFLKLVDQTGDGKINSDDRVVIGNANPNFIGGMNNTFSYKGIDLSVFLNWSYGNDVYNANKLNMSQTNLDYKNAFAYVANRWMSIDAAGQRVTDPVALAALNEGKTIPLYNGAGTGLRLYDQMIEDGSFLRISNVSLGYTLPKAWLSKVKVSGARIYVTGYNLHTFTKYSGYDPEVSTANSTGLTPGVDFGAYPRTRSFVAGVNVSF